MQLDGPGARLPGPGRGLHSHQPQLQPAVLPRRGADTAHALTQLTDNWIHQSYVDTALGQRLRRCPSAVST